MFNYFFSENLVVYEIMSRNMVEPERPQRIWRMRFACWINKATRTHTHTHTHRPICNTYCFSTATMIRERATKLRYMNIVCLVISIEFYIYVNTKLINLMWLIPCSFLIHADLFPAAA
jgi:hypothetical protein